MVARKRFNSMNLGSEKTQEVSGFSRIAPEVFARNKHSGLYFASLKNKSKAGDVNGRYIKRNQQKVLRKSKHCGQQKGKFANPNGHGCNFKNRFDQQKADSFEDILYSELKTRPLSVKKNVLKVKQSGQRHYVKASNAQDEFEDALLKFRLTKALSDLVISFSDIDHFKLSRKQYFSKLKVLNEMIWTCEKSTWKAKKLKQIMVSNRDKLSKSQIRRKCKSEYFSKVVRDKRMKFKHERTSPKVHKHWIATAIKNKTKGRVDNSKPNAKNCWKLRRCSDLNFKPLYSPYPSCDTGCEYALMMQAPDIEDENKKKESEKSGNRWGLTSFTQYATDMAKGDPNPSIDVASVNRYPVRGPAVSITMGDDNHPHDENEMSPARRKDPEGELHSPPPTSVVHDTKSIEFSDLVSKKDSSESDEPNLPAKVPPQQKDGGASSIALSSILQSSSVYRPKDDTFISRMMKELEDKKRYISMTPDENPLREDGLLPPISKLDDLIDYFDPFIVKMMDLALQCQQNDSMIHEAEIERLGLFVMAIVPRFVAADDTHKVFFDIVIDNAKHAMEILQKVLQRKTILSNTSIATWNLKKNASIQLSQKNHGFNIPNANNGDSHSGEIPAQESQDAPFNPTEPIDSENNNAVPPSSRPSSSSSRKSNKKKRKEAKKLLLALQKNGILSSDSSDSENDDGSDSDNLYRKILRELMKSAKNYKIKELAMVSDPSQRREKFNNWIIDLRNVLSTHSKTLGILDDYPADVPHFSKIVDRAVKALLSSITTGMAKQLVGNADSAHQALLDLKRNYGQTSSFDIHRERLRMMMMKQHSQEKASDFLRRVRRQLRTCASVGCQEYLEEESADANVVNIILGGLDSTHRLYAATIAELKARFRSNPQSISFIDLEELFFNIDDNINASKQNFYKKEHANYIVGQSNSSNNKSSVTCFRCGKKGHVKKDCRVKLPPGFKLNPNDNSNAKRDISKVRCFKCNQLGHYANKCPNSATQSANEAKKVTFESAHVAKEGDESCKVCTESYGNISNYGNNFDFKFQNYTLSSSDITSNKMASLFPSCNEIANANALEYQNKRKGHEKWHQHHFKPKLSSQKAIFSQHAHRTNTMDRVRPPNVPFSLKHNSMNNHQKRSNSLLFDSRDSRGHRSQFIECENDNSKSYINHQRHKVFKNYNTGLVSSSDTPPKSRSGSTLKNLVREGPIKVESPNLEEHSCKFLDDEIKNSSINSTISGPDYASFPYPQHEILVNHVGHGIESACAEIAFVTNDKLKRTSMNHSSLGDLANWLFDSGATSHFTPYLEDLQDVQKLNHSLMIKVADGSMLKATHQGKVSLSFISDQGNHVTLRLLRVLYVEGLQTRLFSIESFTSDGKHQVNYASNVLKLKFAYGITKSIDLPHHPPASFLTTMMNTRSNKSLTKGIKENKTKASTTTPASIPIPPTHDPSAGGELATTWLDNGWQEHKWHLKNKRRMGVEEAHRIFGHRAVSSLLWASNSNVWDDITLFAGDDIWCDSCRIATAPKNARSKATMRFKGRPLEYMFVDLVPSPGKMNGVKGYNESQFLFMVDPISRYATKINMTEKSTKATIEALVNWRKEMVAKGFHVFFFLRSDAGTNFTSDEFSQWCKDEGITLTIAGPKHQEQNAYAETTYKTVSQMARKMLVHAHLPLDFFHFALDYALLILRVLPPKNLMDEKGNPLTTYQVLHHMKPRVSRFKVFGCPVVFKRYQPYHQGKLLTDFQQLQQGSRGTFVGFPLNQAGWLIYVPERIKNSHLVVSTDVVFDQQFISLPVGTKKPFAQSQTERNMRISPNVTPYVFESTGDVTTMSSSQITHWSGGESHFKPDSETSHNKDTDSVSQNSNSDDGNESDDEPVASKEFMVDVDAGSQQVDGFRRSRRLLKAFTSLEQNIPLKVLTTEAIMTAIEESAQIFYELCHSAEVADIPVAPYLPEPKNIHQIMKLPPEIREGWIKAIIKELKYIIDNGTFRRGEDPVEGDEVVPSIIIFKAKITSRGFLDKLKARCVARGDLQHTSDDPDVLWSPCVFARTFKMFVAQAVKHNRPINQLDFIGAFCQALIKDRLFLALPKEYACLLPPEYAEYFDKPQLLSKSIYGLNIAAKAWNEDLTEWLTSNSEIKFTASEVDASLFVHRNGDAFIYLIIYVDDCLYFGSSNEIEEEFAKALSKRFKLETQGWSHWFLGTRLYREEDGSYNLDQENYIRHVLNRYCSKDSLWGLPPMQTTPAPVDYVYSKDNRPKSDEERAEVKKRFAGLSMPSAVSSLLYAALNTRVDILWVTNKLAKSCTDPGVKDFEALLHVFGYLRAFPDYGLKFYADISQSPVYEVCKKNDIGMTDILAFSDTSWQDCPDTGRSTAGYKIFVQGGLVDAQSTMPVPVALSSAEAEYMGACNAGAMVCHLRDLIYDFEFLGTENYNVNATTAAIPSIILVDNQATVRMSKNYKVTGKNRHVGRRWHFVRQGVKGKLFNLEWIPGNDQLADDCTKTQPAHKSRPQFERTLIKVSDKVKGFKSNVIGNR